MKIKNFFYVVFLRKGSKKSKFLQFFQLDLESRSSVFDEEKQNVTISGGPGLLLTLCDGNPSHDRRPSLFPAGAPTRLGVLCFGEAV